jgi:hypothetical protein
MRELHGWQSHGEHRHRHARDAGADIHPKHSADTPRFRVLADPEVRKAEFLKYQRAVQQDDAKYEPKHAIGRFKPQRQSRTTRLQRLATSQPTELRALTTASESKNFLIIVTSW